MISHLLLITLLFLSVLPGRSGRTAPSDPFVRIILRDVQGLWGGRDVWLYADGRMVVQVVDPSKREKAAARHEVTVGVADVATMQSLLDAHHFAELVIPVRAAVPDEAHPAISVEYKSGLSHMAQKWANDKNADFDAIYEKLLELAKRADGTKVVFEGPYDLNWTLDEK